MCFQNKELFQNTNLVYCYNMCTSLDSSVCQIVKYRFIGTNEEVLVTYK